MATELPPERLRRTFDPAQITLPATEAPPGDSGIIGQQRAVAVSIVIIRSLTPAPSVFSF